MIVIVVIAVVTALTLAFGAYGLYAGGTDTIFRGVSVDGVALGGMSMTEAAEELQNAGWEREDETVEVQLTNGAIISVDAAEVGASVSAEQAAQAAYAHGHGGNVFQDAYYHMTSLFISREVEVVPEVDTERLVAVIEPQAQEIMLNMMSSEMEIKSESVAVVKGAKSVTVDTEELSNLVSEALLDRDYDVISYEASVEEGGELDIDGLHADIYAEMSDAYYDTELGVVVESVVGRDFDKAEAQRLWDEAAYGETVEIALTITQPNVDTATLESMLFRDQLATNTTSMAGSSAGRKTNIILSAAAINGTVLNPGESFSFNEVVGQRTAEKGYQYAGAYTIGEVVSEIGGGICQVSSTIYYSALLSNLQIDNRLWHYFPVYYLPPGMDATVSWGGPEFVFTNSRDYPIRIDATTNEEDSTLTVSIVGTDVDGSYVEMSYATWPVYALEEHPEIATGHKALTYRNVYDKDGNLISRTEEAYSTYAYDPESLDIPSPSPSAEPSDGTEYDPTPDVSAEPTESEAPTESETPTATDAVGTETEAPTMTETPTVTETPSTEEPVTT